MKKQSEIKSWLSYYWRSLFYTNIPMRRTIEKRPDKSSIIDEDTIEDDINVDEIRTKKEKILLVLGNGFDLDLGLKTSYYDFANTSDFWPKCSDSALGRFMNKQKEEQGRNWGGVETALEEYATQPIEVGMFEHDIKAFKVLVESLRLYLHRILRGKPRQYPPYFNSKITFDTESLAYYLCDYLLRDRKVNEIITFNYTDINEYLKQIAEEEGLPFEEIPRTFLHREDDGLMALGISSDAKLWDRRYDFLKKSHQIIQKPILRKLFDADTIIFYGLSFSRSDHSYLKQFFNVISDFNSGYACKKIFIVSRDNNSYQNCVRGIEDMLGGDISQLYQLNNVIQVNTDRQKESKGASYLLSCIQVL